MRLTTTQIETIAALVMRRLTEEKLIVFKVDPDVVLKRIHAAILDDIKAEADLDREVEGLLRDHSAEIESGSVDYRRIFSMIKGKLVRERESDDMKLSDDRISHIAHMVLDGIWNDDLVDFTDDDKALKEIKARHHRVPALRGRRRQYRQTQDPLALKGRTRGEPRMGDTSTASTSKRSWARRAPPVKTGYIPTKPCHDDL